MGGAPEGTPPFFYGQGAGLSTMVILNGNNRYSNMLPTFDRQSPSFQGTELTRIRFTQPLKEMWKDDSFRDIR